MMRGQAERSTGSQRNQMPPPRKDYEIHMGISLAIDDPSGLSAHEIQYWGYTKFLPPFGNVNEL
jgi:hypothetical protein